MELLMFIFLAVIPVISDGLTVRGPSGPLVAPLGSSVVLRCYVDKPLPMEDLEVEWKRTDSDILVHLYQDGESQTETQEQDYQDRAHFFTEEIQHGNFSLRLDKLRAEDEGQYTCTVYNDQDSGETVVQIKDVVRLLVSGSDKSISASVGEDVTLNCSVDSHITPEHTEVAWKKTDENIQVLLFQNNKTLPDSAHVRYTDRVEFFTDETPKGNFSLRLKSVRTEDKGVYMCHVFAGGLSANTTVVLERLGFSVLHILVLILCVSASGSALLLCCLIYCRNQNGFTVMYSQNARVDLGSSVVLNFYRVKPLQMEGLKVEWRRKGTKTLVHLYQDGESRPQQDYQERAHFIIDQIQHGNFSLRLDNVKEEDAGEYICRVCSKQRCVFSTQITLEMDFPYLNVKVSSAPLVAPLGSSVVLPCFCGNSLHDLKVEWRRKDTLVHLYQDGESQADEQQQDYQDRVHLFTEEIEHGNFSLRLDDLRAEDEGQYTCKVYNKQRCVFSTQTSLEPRLLDSVLHLHLFLVVCPNMIMFFAFVFWGVSEGSVSETVCCCALYFLRPLLLLWAAPHINNRFSVQIKTWIQKYSYVAEYAVFSVVVYSALFASAWEKFQNYAVFNKVIIIVLFAIVFVCCLCKITYILVTEVGKKSGRIIEIFDLVADMTFQILPTLQFILVFYTFGAGRGGLITIVILPVLMMMTNERWLDRCYDTDGLNLSRSVMKTVMLVFILVTNALMIGLYIFTLDKQTDPIGWGCVMVFLQMIWTVMYFTAREDYYIDLSLSRDFHRYVSVYVFGSVAVVLLNSAALITELILKTVNGDRMMADLRFIVFPSECLFAASLLISGFSGSKIAGCLKSCQNKVRSIRVKRSQKNQSTEETEEGIALRTGDQEHNQPDSVQSQT